MNNKMLDVHHLTLDAAIKVIEKNIETSYNNNVGILYVNHGFNKGNKIKTWCKNEAIKNRCVLRTDSGENEGITNIYIKINIK